LVGFDVVPVCAASGVASFVVAVLVLYADKITSEGKQASQYDDFAGGYGVGLFPGVE